MWWYAYHSLYRHDTPLEVALLMLLYYQVHVNEHQRTGPRLNIKTVLSKYAISMLKIRRPLGRLIFNMGIAIPGKTVFLIETAPRDPFNWYGSTLIPAWISNNMPSNVWDEITYPFLIFNGATVEV